MCDESFSATPEIHEYLLDKAERQAPMRASSTRPDVSEKGTAWVRQGRGANAANKRTVSSLLETARKTARP